MEPPGSSFWGDLTSPWNERADGWMVFVGRSAQCFPEDSLLILNPPEATLMAGTR